jgi:hypothetical protein
MIGSSPEEADRGQSIFDGTVVLVRLVESRAALDQCGLF